MRRILLALTALAVAHSAPGASAAFVAVQADCGVYSITDEEVASAPDTYTGFVYGYAISDTPGASISIHCEVRVNGNPVASTPPGPSGQASFTSGPVVYTAAAGSTVTLCAVWTGTESGEVCDASTNQQLPPQEVQDLTEQAADLLADLLNSLAGACISLVNTGTCSSGICLVNTGSCNGGICLVNSGNCRRGCIAVVNLGRCGHRAVTYTT